MTDTTGRNRVQAGVPTGGQFSVETKKESTDLDATQITTKDRLTSALEQDPKGTHGRTLKMLAPMYEALADIPEFDPAETDAMVDRMVLDEFKRQSEVEEAMAVLRFGGGERANRMRRFRARLFKADKVTFELHPNQSGAGHGQAWVVARFPRTGVGVPVLTDRRVLSEPEAGYEVLSGFFDAAASYEMETPEQARRRNGFPDTDEGRGSAERAREYSKVVFGMVREAVNADYPMYVHGQEPTE